MIPVGMYTTGKRGPILIASHKREREREMQRNKMRKEINRWIVREIEIDRKGERGKNERKKVYKERDRKRGKC